MRKRPAARKTPAAKKKAQKSTKEKKVKFPEKKSKAKKKDTTEKAGEKATFAKRYRPSTKHNREKYDGIRDVYNSHLRKYLTGHTYCEDRPGSNKLLVFQL
jgi:hypothetical protein